MECERSIGKYPGIVLPAKVSVGVSDELQALRARRAAEFPLNVSGRLVDLDHRIEVAERDHIAGAIGLDGIHVIGICWRCLYKSLPPPPGIGFSHRNVIHRRPVPDQCAIERRLFDDIIEHFPRLW